MDNTPQPKTPLSGFKILTLNARGLNTKHKCLEIFDEIKQKHCDIVLLQEVNCVSQELFHSWGRELNARGIISLSPQSHTRGTIIFITNSSPFTIQHTFHCANDLGYAIAMDMTDGINEFRVVNVHFPQEFTRGGHSYLNHLMDWLHLMAKTRRPLILGGDFNCVENTILDAQFRKEKQSNNVKYLKNLCHYGGLMDPFRAKYPARVAFTHVSTRASHISVSARLDRFYISKTLLPSVKDVFILPCVLSDHDYVILSLSIQSPFPPRGPGYWKLNASILDNPDTIASIEDLWYQELQNVSIPDSDWWEYCKIKFKERLIFLSRKFKHDHNLKKNELKQQIIYYRKLQNASFQPDLFQPYIDAKEMALDELLHAELKGSIIRSRVQDIEEGEKPTRYFFNKEMMHGRKKEIKSLNINGTVVDQQQDILNAIFNFYTNLYTNEPINEPLADKFLTGVTPMSEDDATQCEGLLTYDECWQAIMLMQNNKSPGQDGLTVEFYKKFFYLFGTKLVAYYNSAFVWGKLTPSQRLALITLLYKNFDLQQLLPQWRPISLLTIDYKIISKAMSLRLKHILPNLIHYNQKCSVEGRSIHDGNHLIRNIIDYVQDRPNMGLAILNLDIKKAFDTISYAYITKVLAAYGFGPQFQQWLHLLYHDITAQVIVNGYFTDSFPISRGVRQGCSLSPLLYVLCVEPLAEAIRNNDLIKGFPLPGGEQVKLCQYADDITGFLADLSSVQRFLDITQQFGEATGARLNKDKCSGIWLGKFSHNNMLKTFANITWEMNAKILGIYAGINDVENANWQTLIDQVSARFKNYTIRNLTLKGSAIITNTKVLSILWYRATILNIPTRFVTQLNSLLRSFMWNNKMHLIRQETLELPTLKGGIELVSMTTKVKAFRIKHVLDLIFDKKRAEWKALARYWLGIRLKAMDDVKQYIDWRGPFAETPNHFYQKCFELFKQFMKLYKQLRNPIELCQLTTKYIYDTLLSTQRVIPNVEQHNPLIKFNIIYKSFTTVKLQSHDLNFAYQVIHRAINVRSKLKKFHIITDDTCPLCHQTSETIEHLFVHCPRIQLAKHYLETILSTTIPIVITALNSLQCIYPPGITKHQQTLIYSFIILFQNAIWKHRNEVIFQYKPVSASTIIIILRHKIINLLNIKKHQLDEYIYRAQWTNIENQITPVPV